MAIRNDHRIEIEFYDRIDELPREETRNLLLETWKAEAPTTQYRYYVEILQTEKRIYLERPGRLNKGCDFVILVEDLILYNNGNDKPPRHQDLIADLRSKEVSDRLQFLRLRSLIKSVYECDSLDSIINQANRLTLCVGWPSEVILKIVKWFFIEQDITYWNRTGRQMLWNEIHSI